MTTMPDFRFADTAPRTYLLDTGNLYAEPGSVHTLDSAPDGRWVPSGGSAKSGAAVSSTPVSPPDAVAEPPVTPEGPQSPLESPETPETEQK